MSIIHEALKKAQQKSQISAGLDPVKISFTTSSSPWYKKNLPIGIIAIAGICFVVGLTFLPIRTLQNKTLPNEQLENEKVPLKALGLGPISGESSTAPLPLVGDLDKNEPLQLVMDQGITFFKNGQYDEAENQFLKVIGANPRDAEPHNALGLVYKTKGQMGLAKKHYQKALELNPDFAGALNNMAVLYEQTGQDAKAIEFFKKALSINPGYPEAHLNYALLLDKIGRLDQAKEEYQFFLSNASSDQKELINLVKERINHL